jgi:hypothetical protein
MKKIVMSLMTICLVAGLVGGGLFADFSDIETSRDNFFQTGALDLKVSDFLGTEYQDPNVPAFYEITDALPCCDKSIFLDLENYGQGFQVIPWAYVHFKNLECYWVVPKNVWKWVDANGDECDAPVPTPVHGDTGVGFPKPLNEPEYVAECGGEAGEDVDGNPVIVPGIGVCYGESGELAEHIGVLMWKAGPYPHATKPATSSDVPAADWELVTLPDPNGDGVTKMDEVFCEQIEVGQIPMNEGMWIHMSLHFQDFDEEDAFAQGLIPTTYFDESIPAEAKWDHWPTNAMQKDGMRYDMAFELLQNPLS